VDLPALLAGHYRVMVHRWSAYQIRPVGWSAGRMILSSPALLNRGDARGEVDRNLFMEAEERFAADPRTGTMAPLGPNARDPIAYYIAHRRLPGQTKPGLVALGDRSAIPRLQDLLTRTADEVDRHEITGIITELEKLPLSPRDQATPPPSTTQPAVVPAPAGPMARVSAETWQDDQAGNHATGPIRSVTATPAPRSCSPHSSSAKNAAYYS